MKLTRYEINVVFKNAVSYNLISFNVNLIWANIIKK